jgi:hypothetical protein
MQKRLASMPFTGRPPDARTAGWRINDMRHDGAFDYASLVWAIQIRLAAA